MNIRYEGREIEGERLELAEKDRLIYSGVHKSPSTYDPLPEGNQD